MQQNKPDGEEVSRVVNNHIYLMGNHNQIYLDSNNRVEKPLDPKRENIFSRFFRWVWRFFKRVIGNPFGDNA